MENVASFVTDGLANLKNKMGNNDKQNEIDNYRRSAKEAYSDESYSEANQYYKKILSINPRDFDAIFFVKLCTVLCTAPNKANMQDVFKAYMDAKSNIPVELDWNEVEQYYAFQMADLVLAWYRIFKQEYDNQYCEWYKHNLNTHGTGCTLSSAIAANLAKGYSLDMSIYHAKQYISQALSAGLDLGKGSGPMDHAFIINKGEFS